MILNCDYYLEQENICLVPIHSLRQEKQRKMSSSFVKWDDAAVEPSIPNESELASSVVSNINKMQMRNFSHHRRGFRGTHVKTQAIVKGTLTVVADLPDHLAQGPLFSSSNAGKPHPVAIRYANEPTFLQDDRAPGPRGCGMKVFSVDAPDAAWLDLIGARTHVQDFTFNNAPLLELRDVKTCSEIIDLRCSHFDDPEGLKSALSERADKDLQFAPAGLPNQHFLSYAMYSQSAYRWGDFVAKYALFPVGKLQASLADRFKIGDESDPEQHSIWLADYFAEHDAEYEFRVQLCCDIKKQSVEDCSVAWNEEEFPFQTVGKVTIPKQESFGAARRTFWEDHMKLNVWYGLDAYRPLGSVNRLRKELYKASVQKREALNANEVTEIKSIDEIP